MRSNFSVTGMTCSACSAHVEKAVNKLPAVRQVLVDLVGGSMRVDYDESATSAEAICKAVEDAGYGASLRQPSTAKAAEHMTADTSSAEPEEKLGYGTLIASIAFLLLLMYLSMGHMGLWPIPAFFHQPQNAPIFALTQFLLTLPILYLQRGFFIRGYKALFHGAPTMDTLVCIGSSAAIVYGLYTLYAMLAYSAAGDPASAGMLSMDLYFESGAMILTLVAVGKTLEKRSKKSAVGAISELMKLAPRHAIRVTLGSDGEELTREDVGVELIRKGDILLVRSGDAAAADGVVVRGSGHMEEASLTGESMPRGVKEGDKVLASSTNVSGAIYMRVEAVAEDTAFAKIIELVRDAAISKAPIARLADKVSGVFVPIVLVLALLTGIVWLLVGQSVAMALRFAISVLVISCPCALGLATPIAIVVGTGKGAENGLLFRSAEALETANAVSAVVLDKTGTLTEGKMAVAAIVPANGIQENELLTAAFALEQLSEHPLAKAICTTAKEKGIPAQAVEDFLSVAGKGVQGKLGGAMLRAGSARFLSENGVDMSNSTTEYAAQGYSLVCVARDNTLLGTFAIGDRIKEHAAQAIALLKKMKIHTVLLTGDTAPSAQAVASKLGIDECFAEKLSHEKEEVLRGIKAKGYTVAMVGDGVNDAPSLMRADVGFAIGAGTNIAIESADVVLVRNDIRDVAKAIKLSRAVLRNIKQNLFWAFFYNVLGIPVAAGVLFPLFGLQLSPMLAAAAMSFSSVFVVTNALRLRRIKLSDPEERPTGAEKKENKMKKVLTIEGMMCAHCSARVEKALSAVDGVTGVAVDLGRRQAAVEAQASVTDDALRAAVENEGYRVIVIE